MYVPVPLRSYERISCANFDMSIRAECTVRISYSYSTTHSWQMALNFGSWLTSTCMHHTTNWMQHPYVYAHTAHGSPSCLTDTTTAAAQATPVNDHPWTAARSRLHLSQSATSHACASQVNTGYLRKCFSSTSTSCQPANTVNDAPSACHMHTWPCQALSPSANPLLRPCQPLSPWCAPQASSR